MPRLRSAHRHAFSAAATPIASSRRGRAPSISRARINAGAALKSASSSSSLSSMSTPPPTRTPPLFQSSRVPSVVAAAAPSSPPLGDDKEAKKAAKRAAKEAKKAQKRALAGKGEFENEGKQEEEEEEEAPAVFLEAAPGVAASPPPPSPSHHYSREDALWDRSDALWKREMARWDAERRAWDEREAALLSTVGALQREVGRLSALLPPGAASATAAPPPAAATPPFVPPAPVPAAPPPVAAVPPVAAAPASAPTASNDDADDDGSPFVPPSGVSFAEHLAAAVAAVSGGEVDVLRDDSGGHAELLARGAAALGLNKREGEEEKDKTKPLARAAATAAADQSRKATTASPPSLPDLIEGADDLYWVNALQNLLDSHAMHCGDDEAEDFFFGPRTRTALETFQACEGLPETGMCDAGTWLKLVRGSEEKLRELVERAPKDDEGGAIPAPPGIHHLRSHQHTHTVRVEEDAGAHVVRVTEESEDEDEESDGEETTTTKTTSTTTAVISPDSASVISSSTTTTTLKTTQHPPTTTWPILREGDGGRLVHALQVALENAGMSCGEDDEQWWQFGDSTYSALVTFQACSGLPESGVADERTWRSLLLASAQSLERKSGRGGSDGRGVSTKSEADLSSFSPSDIDPLMESGDAHDDDMLGNHHAGMVFLLGEQRWEKKRE